MKKFLALLIARNKEFYRDKASLSWNFVFPVLIIVGCAVAFSNPDTTIFKVGLNGDIATLKKLPFVQEPYVKTYTYGKLTRGLDRIEHHQLDLLISSGDGGRYWVNPQSAASRAAEQLFHQHQGDTFRRGELEGSPVRYVDWVMPGVLGMNIMFGSLFGVGYVIVRYRLNGVLKRLQVTPVTPLAFISAQLVSRLMIVVAINVAIFLGCYWLLHLLVLGNWLLMLLIAVLGSLAMVSLGLLIASRTASEELAGGLLNLSTWPMLFFSEVWFSLDNAPHWMRQLADLMPLTHIVKALRAVMIDGAGFGDVAAHLVWLMGLTAVFLLLAAWLFRWHRTG